MSNKELDKLQDILNKLGDNNYWEPFYDDEVLVDEFNNKLQLVKDSRTWAKERNKEKGNALEELVKFIFNRFSIIESIERDKNTNDNEIDIHVDFNKNLMITFFSEIKGKLICECKNIDKTVDVGMVSKLVELCDKNHAGLGVFISLKGLSKGRSGSLWKYAEGKRRKLFLSTGIPIISFKLDEIECLNEEGNNFYTMIKQRLSYLIDEIQEDSTILELIKKEEGDFKEYLYSNLNSLEQLGLINMEEKEMIIDRIKEKYGK